MWAAHAPTVHTQVISFIPTIVERQVLEVNTLHHHHILVTMKFLLCHREVRHPPAQRHRHISSSTNACRQQQRHHRHETVCHCHHRVPVVVSRLSRHQMACDKRCSRKAALKPIMLSSRDFHSFRMAQRSMSRHRHIPSAHRWHRQATQRRSTVDRVQRKTTAKVPARASIRAHQSAQRARQVPSLYRKAPQYPPSVDQYRSCPLGVHRDKRKHNIPSSCNR